MNVSALEIAFPAKWSVRKRGISAKENFVDVV